MNKKLLIVLLSNYGAVISLGFFTPIFALYIVKLGGTAAEAGIASAIYYVLAGVLMIIIRGVINSSSNRPKYYILGNGLEAVAAFLFIAVNSVTQFYMVQVLHALATSLRVPSQWALYAQYEDKGKEGSQWSIMEGGNFIIIGLAAAAGGIVVTTFSFEAVFAMMGVAQTLTMLCSLQLLKRSRSHG